MTELIIIAILSIACILSGIELLKDQKLLDTYRKLYDLRNEMEKNKELFTRGELNLEAYYRSIAEVKLEVEQLESEIE